jgi:hypothetical protein
MENLKTFLKKMICATVLMLSIVTAFCMLREFGFAFNVVPVYLICLMSGTISFIGVMQKPEH